MNNDIQILEKWCRTLTYKVAAERLGVPNWQNVHNWIKRGQVPSHHIPSVVEALDGQVTADGLARAARESWQRRRRDIAA